MTCQTMMSLGVYVLGAADAEESRQVRAHLPDCPACRAELALLRPLPGLLARVPEDTLAADPPLGRAADQGPGRGARQRPGRGARQRPGRGADQGPGWGADRGPGWGADRGPGWGADQRAGRSAALVSGRPAIAGSAGGFWLAPRAAGHRPATVTLSGANPALHVNATAALTATSWGTSIELRVDGLPLNVPCRLIVRSRAGATEITGVWDAWRTGPVTVPASAGWLPSDIASLQVATTTRNLVTITGRPANVAG
jgi:hypothetical protein